MIIKPRLSCVKLNQTSVYSKNLEADYLFNHNGHKVIDFTKNKRHMDIVGADWYAGGLRFNASGERAEFDNTDQIVNSEVGTIIIWFKGLGVLGGTHKALFASYGLSTAQGVFAVFAYASNTLAFIFADNVTYHRIRISSSQVPNWQNGTMIAVAWNRTNDVFDNKKMAIAIDGQYKIPDLSTNASSYNSFTVNTPLYVGNDALDTTKHCNGIISDLSIYNKVFPEKMLKKIYTDNLERYRDVNLIEKR
jgi:hypothetical protein